MKLGISHIFEFDLHPAKNLWDRAFIFLFIISLVLRLLFLSVPAITRSDGMIFDEIYYVNAVRNILGLPLSLDEKGNQKIFVGAQPYSDPNWEHPPLAKAIVAVFVMALGDNSWGYRLPSVIFGMVAILFMYLLAKKLTASGKVAFFATFLFSFDVLVFVHSRIFTLDIFLVSFMIVGFYYYLRGNLVTSGVFLALSTLCKIGGIYGVVALAIYQIASKVRVSTAKGIKLHGLKAVYRFIERFGSAYFAILLVVWEILDFAFVKLPEGGWHTANVFQHMYWLFGYTTNLRVGAYTWQGDIINIEGQLESSSIISPPWLWLINQRAIPYLLAAVSYYANGKLIRTVPSMQFFGVMNPALVAVALPSVARAFWLALKKGKGKAELFGLTWWASTYLVWYGMALMDRVLYLFYMIQAVGAICLLAALALNMKRFSKLFFVGFTCAILVGFAYYYPYKMLP